MSIIHIIDSMKIGGVEVGILNLMFHDRRYKVLAVNGMDPEFYDLIPSDIKSNIIICNNYLEALKKIKNENPSVIISSLWRAHFLSLLYKVINSNILRVHFVHSSRFAHFIDKIITKISLNNSKLIICDSEDSKDWSLKYSPEKTIKKVVPMNISFSCNSRVFKNDELSFVYAGRISNVKRLDLSIDFIYLLVRNGYPATFHIYGPNSGDLDNIKDKIEKLNMGDYIHIKNSIFPLNVENVLKKYNFYLQTSSAEGMAISVFQSIKNGLLPVVTPVGEIKNYTENGLNSFYIDKGSIDISVDEFIDEYNNGFKGYSIGTILHEEKYPEFAKNYFEVISKYL